MIKAKVRWCSCRVENILTLSKLTQTLHLSRKLRDSPEFLPLYLSHKTDTPKSLDCPGNSPNEVAREK